MEKLTAQTAAILQERFGKDSVIALATSVENIPYVRNVNAIWSEGKWYAIDFTR